MAAEEIADHIDQIQIHMMKRKIVTASARKFQKLNPPSKSMGKVLPVF